MSGAWLLQVIAAAVVVGGWALVVPAGEAVAAPHHKGVAVSGGYLHTCAVTTRGAAVCWGYNLDGELGNGSTIDSPRPVGVLGLGSKVKAISSGNQFSCALTTRGKVWCWGYNGDGELGNNSTVSSLRPVAVVGLGKVKAIDAGFYHACAITVRGGLKCWGSNQDGRLGNGSTTDSLIPVAVPGLTRRVKAVSASDVGTCALTTGGAVKCWGYNNDGELGNGTDDHRSLTPVGVVGLTRGVKHISYGYRQACAVTGGNAVKCWGLNDVGQLGNDSTAPTLVPVGVHGLTSGIKSVQVGGQDACVLTLKGTVKCWGANWSGQLGDNSTRNSLRPVAVYNLDKARALATGFQHTCVVTTRKAIKCWGSNEFGEVGDNTTTDTPRPVRVFGF